MKRKARPDNRPYWSDKSLPVFGKSGLPIDPAKMNIVAQLRLDRANDPTWRNDPTYNLKRKK